MIISAVKEIHKNIKKHNEDNDVSKRTKEAQKITKIWQETVCNGTTIKSEVAISTKNNKKIDIIDFQDKIAYELKVSGNNPHHEFYKDIMKVLVYNEYQTDNEKIKKLVFITETI